MFCSDYVLLRCKSELHTDGLHGLHTKSYIHNSLKQEKKDGFEFSKQQFSVLNYSRPSNNSGCMIAVYSLQYMIYIGLLK